MSVKKVGPADWYDNHRIDVRPPGKSEKISDLAEDVIENPILGQKSLRNVALSPKDKVSKQTTKAAFKYFQAVNKASAP